MKSLWDDSFASQLKGDVLQLRVYTSRLIGRESGLVLHGGGNTSVKEIIPNIFGEDEEILYVKGSGWDLATIEPEGFPAIRLQFLRRMAKLDRISDADMVKTIRSAMLDPGAPTPSVESILHAIIPFIFVDHTHADAVVTISNTENGVERIQEIYSDAMLLVPYVMPGFVLAKTVYEMTQNIDWTRLEGMILLHHGIFTFADDAKSSYKRMIHNVSKAERYLEKNAKVSIPAHITPRENFNKLTRIRRAISKYSGSPMIAKLDVCAESVHFSSLPSVSSIAGRGPLTPDHVIRTKRIPVIIGTDPEHDIRRFADAYTQYFLRYGNDTLARLDPAPRWAIWPDHGIVVFGKSTKEVEIALDITHHTIQAIQLAESMGAWTALPEKDIFDVEYWELEQAKLQDERELPSFQGKIAMVTGAASGIGRACVEKLYQEGAVVTALDINAKVNELSDRSGILGLQGDVRNEADIRRAVKATVRHFGGLDILISNAGIFPDSESIAELTDGNWDRSLDINLSSHQRLLKRCIPYLALGIEPSVIFIASKNVSAPGPGAAAYSVAKAGLTQLARVSALELGPLGVRVNVIHPNAVFDTGIWTEKLLKERAKRYEMSVSDYKTNNLLNVEVTSEDVAMLACAMAGSMFAKITGAQIPIDGGNDRVI